MSFSAVFKMYPYEVGFSELVEAMRSAVLEADGRWGGCIPFETIISLAGFDISDTGDSRRCSQAMQRLRRLGLVRYSRRHRGWFAVNLRGLPDG